MRAYTPQMRAQVESTVYQFLDRVQSVMPIKDDSLAREFLLYGFVEATGYPFETRSGRIYYQDIAQPMRFNMNNSTLAVSDKEGHVAIRSVPLHSRFLRKMLVQWGYQRDVNLPVPYSCGDVLADQRLKCLFVLQHNFASMTLDKGIYEPRDVGMPEIRVEGSFLIPGTLETRLVLEPSYHIPSFEVPS